MADGGGSVGGKTRVRCRCRWMQMGFVVGRQLNVARAERGYIMMEIKL
jgi:Fe2+ transport system protein FeoA